MTIGQLLIIAVGGAIGASCRYVVSKRLNKLHALPFGTLLVNLLGSFSVGYIVAMKLPLVWTLFFVTGIGGALTTFSTLTVEILSLWTSGNRKKAVLYGMVTYGGGVGCASLGFLVG